MSSNSAVELSAAPQYGIMKMHFCWDLHESTFHINAQPPPHWSSGIHRVFSFLGSRLLCRRQEFVPKDTVAASRFGLFVVSPVSTPAMHIAAHKHFPQWLHFRLASLSTAASSLVSLPTSQQWRRIWKMQTYKWNMKIYNVLCGNL